MERETKLMRINRNRYSIDIRGYTCPYVQLIAIRAIKRLDPGNILEIILDNPPSSRDVPIAMEKNRFEVLETQRPDEGIWKIVVKK